jgi:hypothetical protein
LVIDTFAYISIVRSIVIALGLTRLLNGLGKVLERRDKVQNYWVHILWAFNLFLYMVLNWWVLFRGTAAELEFPSLHIPPLNPNSRISSISNLISRSFRRKMGFKKHFYEDHRWFFTLATLLPPLDFVDTLLKGIPHLIAQGPIYIITIVLITALSIIAALTKNQTYHKFFAIFFMIYISIFISINLNTLT